MPPESKTASATKSNDIPKHLYDVKKLFPSGVGRCSIHNGCDKSLPKETKDWISKVAFKVLCLQITGLTKCYATRTSILLIHNYQNS